MSTSSLSIKDAYKALAKADRRQSDQYQQVEAEPHDPEFLSHEQRRDTRLLDVIDTEELEDKFGNPKEKIVETVDGDQVFKTVGDVKDTYLKLKHHEIEDQDKTSPLSRLRRQHGRTLEGERQLLQSMESASILFLSLRQSPVEYTRSGRQWVPPFRLRKQLADAWSNVYQVLYNHLQDFPRWEYARMCGYTRSASSPHYHVVVWVDDPDNELSVSTARSAVDSYVKANDYADKQHHQVTKGKSDAGIVAHSVPRKTDRIPTDSYKRVLEHRDGDSFKLSSSFLLYMMTQYPDWVLSHVWDGSSDLHAHDPLVDGATISWASQFDEYGSSRGFPDTPD